MIVITNAESNESKNLSLNCADHHHVHHYKYTLIIISSILKQEKAIYKVQIMHYNVSYSTQHQLPYTLYIIHKPKRFRPGRSMFYKK